MRAIAIALPLSSAPTLPVRRKVTCISLGCLRTPVFRRVRRLPDRVFSDVRISEDGIESGCEGVTEPRSLVDVCLSDEKKS